MLSAIGLEYDDDSSMDFGVDREGISMKRFECAAPCIFSPKRTGGRIVFTST
jgi:hypothetical protein